MSLIVGGLTDEHFKDNIAAVDLDFTGKEVKRLDEVNAIPTIYPYWHQNNFARDRFSEADWTLKHNYE